MIENNKYDFDALNRIRNNEQNKYYPIELLNNDDITKLKLLNERLTNLEIEIAKELKEQIQHTTKKVKDSKSIINDFSCELNIIFSINENSKYYDEDDSNIIMVLNKFYFSQKWDWGYR